MRRLSPNYNQLVEFVRKAYHSLFFPALIVLAVILFVSLWAARTAQISIDKNLQTSIEAQAGVIQRGIGVRLERHEQFVRSIAAYYSASEGISSKEWDTYIQSSTWQGDLEAHRTIGVASRAGSAFVVAHTTATGPGDPDEGADLRNVDTYSSLLTAAENTEQMGMIQNGTDSHELLIGTPFYTGGLTPSDARARDAPVEGIVYSRLDSEVLFDNVLDDVLLRGVKMKAYAGTSTTPLYESPEFSSAPDTVELQKTYYYYGQPIRVELRVDKLALVNKTQLDGPLLIMSGGTLAALMISSIVYLLLMTRSRELQVEKAKDLNLAKDDLLSLASHQLRTPATGVKQYLGMVLQGFAGDVTAQQQKLLEKAYASNDRQLSVINEILHVAKIGAGRIILAKHDMDIGELVQDIINEQMPDIKLAQHTISAQLPVKPITIFADSHMLRMAIENILSNAIKYTPAGGSINVAVTASRLYVKIAIKDNGVGINKQDYAKLFQQFSRIENEMGYHVSGTGVGLYLTKHLVEQHGGRISVSSVVKKGSLFVITLPRHNVPLQTSKKV